MKRMIASCPKCGKEIYEDHPYAWCLECGESLPMEVQARLPARLRSRAAAELASRPLDILDVDPKDLAAIEALVPEAETGRRLFGGLAYRTETFLHIGLIPLYYNRRSHYVFFTERGVLSLQRTTWKGFRQVDRLDYEVIVGLTLEIPRFLGIKQSVRSLSFAFSDRAPWSFNCHPAFCGVVKGHLQLLHEVAPHLRVSLES